MSQFCPCKLVFASGLQGPFLPFYHSFSLCSQAMTLLALSSQQESPGPMAVVTDP